VRSLAVLERGDLELVVPTLVIAEVCYFIAERMGPGVEAEFLRRLSFMDVEAPEPDDWSAIADLVKRYADFPPGATDASVAVLAERLGTDVIVTLDRRHFGAMRTRDGRPLTLLPD
jgi:predicted nucleic acid-binding protein